ncbi:ABC transporter permease [Sphingobacterium faecium]|uniref:ABC transporter permease n=1 Tax=Sphingobacterium faecium TaxID=34087 RepID=UPI003209EF40
MILSKIFKIALVNRTRNLFLTISNSVAITVGFVTFCVMIHYYFYEKSFDKFFDQHSDIYEVRYSEEVEGNKYYWAISAPGLGPALKKEFPEIKNFTRLFSDDVVTIFHDNVYHHDDIIKHVDSTFFDVFSYKFIVGQRIKALKAPNSVVLTESCATKYFGKENPLGRNLMIRNVYGEQWNMIVTGVIEDNPNNSTINFDLVLSNQFFINSNIFSFIPSMDNFFGAPMAKTYIQLKESSSIESVKNKMDEFIAKHKSSEYANRKWEFSFTKIEDVHLNSEHADGETFIHETGNGKYIRLYLVLTFVVILLIITNFSNLYVSEINERKQKTLFRNWLGEKRKYMYFQFFFENMLISSVCIFFTFLILYIIRGWLNTIFEIQIFNDLAFSYRTIFLVVILFILTSILPSTMAYIAIVIKERQDRGIVKSRLFFNITTITQLVIGILVIGFTLTIRTQFRYIFEKDTGINSEDVIVLNLPTLDNSYNKYNKLKMELLEDVGVSSVTGNRYLISNRIFNIRRVKSDLSNDNEFVQCSFTNVDKLFFETFEIPLLAGNYLKEGQPGDAIVINETALKKLKYKDPKDAIGTRVSRGQTETYEREWTVVGVVKDYHQEPLSVDITPQMFFNLNNNQQPVKFIYIKLKSGTDSETISRIRNMWIHYFPPSLFKYKLLDHILYDKYRDERRLYTVMILFTLIFVCNMCLNLFSLSSFIINRKTKAICIRRVLGANTGHVIFNLLKDFYPVVVIAILIASPILIILIQEFLNGFPYRISFPWYLIAITILVLLGIVLLSISYFVVKIIRKKPSDVLKEE